MNYYFDVGGTKVSVYYKKDDSFFPINLFKTDSKHFNRQILHFINHLGIDSSDNLLFALPGTVSEDGVFLTNIDYSGDFISLIRTHFNVSNITLLNDADAFSYGVSQILSEDLIGGAIFGTGIGFGMVYSGKLIQSKRGGFGEIGKFFEDQFNSNEVKEYLKHKGYNYEMLEKFEFNKELYQIKMDLRGVYKKVVSIFNLIENCYSPDCVALSGSFSKFIQFLFSIYNYSSPFKVYFFPSKYIILGLDAYSLSN